MRFMYLVKHPGRSGNPTPELMEAMGKLADREIKAGRMLDCGGLMPVQTGAPLRIADGKRSGIACPFVEGKEGLGGHATLQNRDKPEAPARAHGILRMYLGPM